MSYTPTTWVTGDIVTADKLNKLENGVSDSVLCIIPLTENIDEQTGDSFTAISKTWQEIFDMVQDGKIVLFRATSEYKDDDTGETIEFFYLYHELYEIGYISNEEGEKTYYVNARMHNFYADEPNDYPMDGGQQ